MDWLESSRQAVLDSAWSVISNVHAQVQRYRPWNNNQVNLKSLLHASLLAAPSHDDQPGGISTSCQNAQLSCHNTSVVDTCCLNHPGGLMLQTQFWDSNPPVGPLDSWTVHGLWFVSCSILLYDGS
jgi:hypothetical protein